MKITSILLRLFLICIILHSCTTPDHIEVISPNDNFRFELRIEDSQPVYRAYFKGQEIIRESAMGFTFLKHKGATQKLTIKSVKESNVDSSWKPIYGERNNYPEQYKQTIVSFGTSDLDLPSFQLNIRAYNEGMAFRYEFATAKQTTIEAELTEFALPPHSEVWTSDHAQGEIYKRKVYELKNTAVERPLLAQLNDSLFVALGEAALIDFARMKFILNKDDENAVLVASLGSSVVYNGAFNSPWRTIMAGNTTGEILENNYLLLNLNQARQIVNADWVKPGKVIREVTLTTKGGIACVDFAVKHNLQYIEFDAGWYGNESDDASDATTITLDPKRSKGPLDLHAVIRHAESKGIGVILYVNRRSLEKQIDEVLPLLKSWGIKGVKYGFVNVGSQKWTRWLHEAVRKAADYELMVDIHDEYRPTGYSRTYPNLMTQEGIRGDEESPNNSLVLKTLFTRMLAGAGDQTSCYFANRVDDKLGSHASQLAKAVCIYSPWQFLYWYDRPINSIDKAEGAGNSKKFIVEVPELIFFDQLPTVWDETKVIEGYPGEYAVVARKSGTTWFVGALNGEQARDYNVPLNFLDSNSTYEATIFTDNDDVKTPTKVAVETVTISSKDMIENRLGQYEGMALIIKKSI